MTPRALEKGYWKAYKEFYRWRSITRWAATKPDLIGAARRLCRWVEKFEPLWGLVIRAQRLTNMLPVLEGILTGFGRLTPGWTLTGARAWAEDSARRSR